MTFCKFHGTVAMKTCFLEIKILSATSGNLFDTVTSIMAENSAHRFLLRIHWW